MNTSKPKHTHQGRPPARHGEDRREHILDNALTLFAAHGIAGTTMAQIAKASGVTSAMVHYYFTNREGLLDSLVAERIAPHIAHIWEGASEDALGDPLRVVAEFVDRVLDVVERFPQFPFLWSREILNIGGQLRERVFALFPVERAKAMQRAFALAQQEGRLNADIVPGLTITSIMAVVMLPLAAQPFLHKLPAIPPLEKGMLRRHALAVLLDGLRPKGDAGGC